jgi:hypothetical protein
VPVGLAVARPADTEQLGAGRGAVGACAPAPTGLCNLGPLDGSRLVDLMTVTGMCELLEIVDLEPGAPSADAIRRLAAHTPLDKHAPGTNMSELAAPSP